MVHRARYMSLISLADKSNRLVMSCSRFPFVSLTSIRRKTFSMRLLGLPTATISPSGWCHPVKACIIQVAPVKHVGRCLIINHYFQLVPVMFVACLDRCVLGIGHAVFHEHQPQMEFDTGFYFAEGRPRMIGQIQWQRT